MHGNKEKDVVFWALKLASYQLKALMFELKVLSIFEST